jgi:uncharacterized protein (TIGR04255 family)
MPEDPPLKLKNPPIVEAVVDIDCDLPPGFEVALLEKSSRPAYGDKYPNPKTQFLQEVKIETQQDGAPRAAATRSAVQALQFRSQDEKQIVQVRAQGFSFNRLAPYRGLDEYLPEIERTWRLYVDLVSPIQTRTIRLRYINRIDLPLTGGQVELDDFFNISPRIPNEKGFKLAGFINQQTVVERDSGLCASWVLTSQPSVEDRAPVIFDITAWEAIAVDPGDWPKILHSIDALRDLKNRIFRNSLTPRCLDLFQ